MTIRSLTQSLAMLSLALLVSCASTRVGRDAEDLNTTGAITMAEWQDFAEKFYQQIHLSAAWQQRAMNATGDKPLVLAIDNFEVEGANRAQYGRLTDSKVQMMNALRSKIVQQGNGRIAVNMDITGDGARSNKSALVNKVRGGARGSVEYAQEDVAGYGEMLAPTIGLQGTIVLNRFNEEGGRAKKVDYQVTFRLIDLRRGITISEGVVPLPKSFRPGFFGL